MTLFGALLWQDFRVLGNALAFQQCLSEVTAGMDCLKFVHTVPVMGLSSSKKWDPERTRLVAATTALTRGADISGAAGGESFAHFDIDFPTLLRVAGSATIWY